MASHGIDRQRTLRHSSARSTVDVYPPHGETTISFYLSNSHGGDRDRRHAKGLDRRRRLLGRVG